MFKTTRALVLRQVPYKEADKILTVLTEDAGKLTVKAAGALRKGSRLGAAAQALCYSEMTLFENAGRWNINEAETLEQFLPLRADLSALSLGAYFAEMLETSNAPAATVEAFRKYVVYATLNAPKRIVIQPPQ